MHPHADAHRRAVREQGHGERSLRRSRGADGFRGHRKHYEQRVTVHADLDAAVLEGVAQHARVCLEDILVTVRAELVLELGRALDVGEKKREGAGRQPSLLAHLALIVSHPAFAKTCCTH